MRLRHGALTAKGRCGEPEQGENSMAADNGANADFKTHERTYEGFTRLLKAVTIVSFVLTAIVVLLLAR